MYAQWVHVWPSMHSTPEATRPDLPHVRETGVLVETRKPATAQRHRKPKPTQLPFHQIPAALLTSVHRHHWKLEDGALLVVQGAGDADVSRLWLHGEGGQLAEALADAVVDLGVHAAVRIRCWYLQHKKERVRALPHGTRPERW